MKNKIDSMAILDALADEAARYEVEEGKPTVESLAACGPTCSPSGAMRWCRDCRVSTTDIPRLALLTAT